MAGHHFGWARAWVFTVVVICLWVATHLSTAAQSNAAKQQAVPAMTRPDIVFVETPEIVSGRLGQRFPKGSSLVRLSSTTVNREPVRLTNGFFAAADPQVNFEGTKILFSGQKKQGERWQIWEMDLDGANKRQLTQCAGDCLRGAYLAAEEIVFTAEEVQGQQQQSYLAVAKTDGSKFRRITFGTAEFELETVLRDGRIVASAPWPLTGGKDSAGTRMFYTLRPDGTALESFRCEHREQGIQTDAEELEDGTLTFVRMSKSETKAGGALEQIQRGTAGSKALGTSHAIYRSPRQLSADELIVSETTAGTNSRAPKFDLYALRMKAGTLVERIFSDVRLSSVQPVTVATHAVPKRFWSTLNPESPDGYFISLDSYQAGDIAKGRIATPIAQVHVLTMNAADGKERSLGVAPVENDGSFYVRVPADAPVRFVLLDAKGQTIREERSWVWSRPGEQRGCTGCHGDKAMAPENRWPLTLKRFDTPTALGEKEHAAETAQAN